MANTSQTSLTGYNPLAPFKPDRRVHGLLVRGNDSFATVWKATDTAVLLREEDNGDDVPAGQPASAFERAAVWARELLDGALLTVGTLDNPNNFATCLSCGQVISPSQLCYRLHDGTRWCEQCFNEGVRVDPKDSP